MQHELEVVQGERCRHLLSKGLYLNAGLAPGEHATGDGNFWCANTQTTYGPDKGFCNGEDCTNATRSCYEAP
jgi:hypothetical protein